MKPWIAALTLSLIISCSLAPEPAVDRTLAAEIAGVKAIDHHAHPVRPTAAGEPADTDYDALPVETLAPSSDPVRMRVDSAALADARQALEGKQLDPVALLDRLGIETMFANRVTLGRGLPPPRFLW